jgi:hypothetical protein
MSLDGMCPLPIADTKKGGKGMGTPLPPQALVVVVDHYQPFLPNHFWRDCVIVQIRVIL